MKPMIGQRWRWYNYDSHVDYIIEIVGLSQHYCGVKGKIIQVLENDPMKRFIGEVHQYTLDHGFWIYLEGQDMPND